MEAVKMVKLVCGSKGTGKTRRMIEMSNNSLQTVKGKIFFLEANNKHIYDLNYAIKYVNTKEYGIVGAEQFLSFVMGMLAADYDIELVYIDGLYKIAQINLENLEEVIKKLEEASQKFEADFVMSISLEEDELPPEIKEYVC
jgi:KaiC/GvpD/RAD55 family RecA-like ATPase